MEDKDDFNDYDQFGGDGDDDIGDDDVGSEGDADGEGEGEPSEGDGQEAEGEGDAEAESDDEDEEGKAKKIALALDGAEGDEEEDDVTHYQSINDRLKRSTVASGTSRYITKYEKARVIGVRAKQLEDGAPALVDTTGMISVVAIAEKELAMGKCPLTVNRPDPNSNKVISVPVSQLIDVIPVI